MKELVDICDIFFYRGETRKDDWKIPRATTNSGKALPCQLAAQHYISICGPKACPQLLKGTSVPHRADTGVAWIPGGALRVFLA